MNSDWWMRSISFGGLHRLLRCINEASDEGLTASQIDALVHEHQIKLTQRSAPPAPTTLYRYRNTLLRLHALRRDGSLYRTNRADPHVCALVTLPSPPSLEDSLHYSASEHFAALVLRNPQCRSVFFSLFLPVGIESPTVMDFRASALPVRWARYSATDIVLWNNQTGRRLRCSSRVSVTSVPYGLRYWARDELGLVDEYWSPSEAAAIMFPVHRPPSTVSDAASPCNETLRLLLSWRGTAEWSSFAISDLISRACLEQRRPRMVLFRTLDWLMAAWPHHVAPIPTPKGLATISAISPQKERLVLRSYYRSIAGQYISHIRLHRDIIPPTD